MEHNSRMKEITGNLKQDVKDLLGESASLFTGFFQTRSLYGPGGGGQVESICPRYFRRCGRPDEAALRGRRPGRPQWSTWIGGRAYCDHHGEHG